MLGCEKHGVDVARQRRRDTTLQSSNKRRADVWFCAAHICGASRRTRWAVHFYFCLSCAAK